MKENTKTDDDDATGFGIVDAVGYAGGKGKADGISLAAVTAKIISIKADPHSAFVAGVDLRARADQAWTQPPEPLAETAHEFSEDELALLFAERYAAELRYVDDAGKWYQFDGQRWKRDDTLKTWTLVRLHLRQQAKRLNDPRRRKALKTAKMRNAVLSLASDDRRLAASADQWDFDQWALCTPGGMIDLRTGDVRPARPEDFCTKITACTPNPNCPTPLWSAFLQRVTANNVGYQEFLARVVGYGLTGSIREHALFFFHGHGGNGKGVFMNTVAAIWGEYHRASPIETFTESYSDRHPTELAGLRGARLVTATETEEGRRWAESRLKTLTGGDPISARLMRQDFSEFMPQFKLMIAGNHKPRLRSVDEAIKRRLYLLPFIVTIPAAERDRDLPEKLQAEWPGILAWAIAGCLQWQAIGLAPPAVVTEATDEYFASEDTLQLWLDECCECGANHFTQIADLFGSWTTWAEARNEYVGTVKAFSPRLEKAGFKYARRRQAGSDKDTKLRGYQGLRLITADKREFPF